MLTMKRCIVSIIAIGLFFLRNEASCFQTNSLTTPGGKISGVFKSQENYAWHSISSTTLSASNDNNESDSDPTGLKRGFVLFPAVLLLATWLFTIPPEFRRARICTEQQIIEYPDKNCMTSKGWISGVSEYYRNGGGIKFDFTIEDK